MSDVIYYSDHSFRKAIYHAICDGDDASVWMPSWTSGYMGTNPINIPLADLMDSDRNRMITERCITNRGKILDKGYKECLSMGITPPMEAMA